MASTPKTFVFLLMLSAAALSAQQAAADGAVTLDNEVVLTVQAGAGAWTPELRAASMTQRLKRWADDASKSETIVIQSNEMTTDLLVDDSPVVTIFEIDAAAEGVTRDQLARRWAASLEDAVARYRARYAPLRIAARIGLALLTIAIMGVLLFLVRKGLVRAERRAMARVTSSRGKASGLTGMVAQTTAIGWVHSLFAWARWISYALVILAGIQLLLLLSPRTRADALQIVNAVSGSLTQLGSRIWLQIPSMILAGVIALVAYQLVQLVHVIFHRVGAGQIVIEGFRPRWAGVTDRLATYFIVVLAFLIMYPYIPGSNSAAFQGIGIFLGALISLGSTGLVGNALAGIMLTYMDGFQVGDFIEIGETKGRVLQTSLMTTQVSTLSRDVVTVPNAIVMGHAMVNHSASRDRGHAISVKLGIGYDVPWRLVEMLLQKAAEITPGMNLNAGASVLTTSLNQFDITHDLVAYVEEGESIPVVRSVLIRNVLDMFNEYGVQIMTPQFEANPHYSVVVPKDKWYPPPNPKGPAEREMPQPTAR